MDALHNYMSLLTQNQIEQTIREARAYLSGGKNPDAYYVIVFYPDNSPEAEDNIMDLTEVPQNKVYPNMFKLKDMAALSVEQFIVQKPVSKLVLPNKQTVERTAYGEKKGKLILSGWKKILGSKTYEEELASKQELQRQLDDLIIKV